MARPCFADHPQAEFAQPSALWVALGCMLLVLLSACATRPAAPPVSESAQSGTSEASRSSRYDMEHDSPLLEPFDPAQVQAVVPVQERRTIAGNKSPYTVNGRTYRVMTSEVGYTEEGNASWYGRKFHGHATSNGETYDMFQLSAAHRSLPIPSYVRVTNLENGRELVVRVNDRGPFHDNRIIDLSYAAASMLGYAEQGTARVRVEAIVPGERQEGPAPATLAGRLPSRSLANASAPSTGMGDYLQVGAFTSLETARGLLGRLAEITALPAMIRSEAADSGELHRVRLGPLDDSVDLETLIQAIIDADLGQPFKVSP